MKRGSQRMITVFITLAILLVVAAVLIFTFSGKLSIVSKSNECIAKGGYCTDDCTDAKLYLEGCEAPQVCCYSPS
jgi:hypothetical protein